VPCYHGARAVSRGNRASLTIAAARRSNVAGPAGAARRGASAQAEVDVAMRQPRTTTPSRPGRSRLRFWRSGRRRAPHSSSSALSRFSGGDAAPAAWRSAAHREPYAGRCHRALIANRRPAHAPAPDRCCRQPVLNENCCSLCWAPRWSRRSRVGDRRPARRCVIGAAVQIPDLRSTRDAGFHPRPRTAVAASFSVSRRRRSWRSRSAVAL